jgi:alkylation response protein AidB-like acyl-CoA dehydrogenase
MRWTIEDTPERAAFREEVRGWLRENLPKGWADAIEAGDPQALEKAREGWDFFGWSRTIGMSGYGAPLWPKEYGGLSGEPWMQNITREELARYRLPTVGVNILGVGLAGPTLIAHGSEEQKARYLQKILTSEEIWCQLFSEPGAGSDLASAGTRAVRSNGEYIINGQKVWTSIAQLSHFGMLLARTDPDTPKHDGLSYFIVDMKSPGVDIRPLKQITGSSEFNEVYFNDVRIPAENLVGTEGDGWRVARTTLMNERVALSGLSLDSTAFTGGARKDPWGLFVDSIPNREDARVRQFIAKSYVEKEVKEITQFRANMARMSGSQPGPEGGVTKVYNAEFNKWRSNGIMNANGPAAIAWENGDSGSENRAHAFLRARANSIEGGTTEILKTQMGERLLGLPREPEVDKGIPWKEIRRS